ncbi:MAG: DUF1772 domain-containing protein [Caldilineaceae bacterium]|nr:DUF1772 domain-containing protein [Caldilineaceae bacterium]
MITETIFSNMLILAAFLCTLATGFVLLFAIVVMPGIGTLSDRDFLRAFQSIDRVIQNNQPIFILIWVGSAVALLIATVLGFRQLEGISRILLLVAATVYIFGMQLPTIAINIPLNNRVQELNFDALEEASAAAEREHFEPRWNRWNVIRTAFASLASGLLLIVIRLL